MLDLRPEWLKMVRDLVAAHLPATEVLAYGSRVRGSAHDGSDLDLIVRNPDGSAVPFTVLQGFREALSESDLPILVDVLDWVRIPESFRKEIERCAVSSPPSIPLIDPLPEYPERMMSITRLG